MREREIDIAKHVAGCICGKRGSFIARIEPWIRNCKPFVVEKTIVA